MKAWYRLVLGWVFVAMAGCASLEPGVVSERKAPAEDMEAREEAMRSAGGIVTLAMGSSQTMSMAENKARRRGRAGLSERVTERVMNLQEAFLAEADVADPAPVRAWFEGVSNYLRGLVETGSVPALERRQDVEGLATVWMLMVEHPQTILDALNVRAPADRQLYELIRASQAYRALEEEAGTFKAYLAVSGR